MSLFNDEAPENSGQIVEIGRGEDSGRVSVPDDPDDAGDAETRDDNVSPALVDNSSSTGSPDRKQKPDFVGGDKSCPKGKVLAGVKRRRHGRLGLFPSLYRIATNLDRDDSSQSDMD